MKNTTIILAIILIAAGELLSQTTEPQAVDFTFKVNGINTTGNLSVDLFPQTNFLFGFHWSGSRTMMKALGMNAKQGSLPDAATDCNYGDRRIVTPPGVWAKRESRSIMQAMAIEYEPTLLIETPGVLKTRPGDPADHVFGFINIKGRIIDTTDPTNDNYSRLILEKDNSNLRIIIVILKLGLSQ